MARRTGSRPEGQIVSVREATTHAEVPSAPQPAPAANGMEAKIGRGLPIMVIAANPTASWGEMLTSLGHDVLTITDVAQVSELLHQVPPDVVVADVDSPNAIAAVLPLCQEKGVPVVLVVDPPAVSVRSLPEPVMARLVKPVKPLDLEAAIVLGLSRFRVTVALRRANADLRQSIEDRKIIETAKAAIMFRLGLSENEAYRALRIRAGMGKVVEIAREIVAAEEVFRCIGESLQGTPDEGPRSAPRRGPRGTSGTFANRIETRPR